MGENVTCCICFLTEDSDTNSNYWTCTACGRKCHMGCISNWAMSNHNRYRSTFSCPMCRHVYDLSSLPGHPVSTPTPVEPLRPGLTGFIATVLQSVTAGTETGEETLNHTLEQPSPSHRVVPPQPPLLVVHGTGAISIQRLTIVNHF